MPTAESKAPVQKQNKIANAVAKVEQGSSGASEQQKTSQGATTGNKTPQEQPEFIKQSLIIIEKKVRNLEKRRTKLDEYKASKTPLNEDQLLAVSKYDEVVRTLELARELEKQFIGLSNDAMKQQKRQAKKEQLERDEMLKERLKEVHKINSLLETFGDESTRNDFLTEASGATKLTEKELTMLDEFHKLIQPSDIGSNLEKSSIEVADHMLFTIEGRNKPITSLNQDSNAQVTYSDMKKLFDRILACSYWNREAQQPEQVQEEQIESAQSEEQNLINEVQTMNLNEQVQNDQEQQMYQNTSDEYVLVNSSDYNPENTQQSQQQQQQSKAFFSTLNPSTNINEFLKNNNEGINFLQDSELQQPDQVNEPQLQEQEQSQAKQQSQSQAHFQNEGHREYRGGRGGHREYNGNRNYDQRKNYEQRRSGGGNYQPRGERGERGDRGDNGQRNGSGGGFRGGRGGFRGGYSNSGQRSGSGGNQNQYPRQQREQPVAHY